MSGVGSVRPPLRHRTLAALALVALLVGCSRDRVLFGEDYVKVAGESLRVLVAGDEAARVQGLRGVSELPPGVDGMLFVWPSPDWRYFTMADTEVPLDIWWFGEDLRLAGVSAASPCLEDPCPLYPSPLPVAYVLETPADRFDFPAAVLLEP